MIRTCFQAILLWLITSNTLAVTYVKSDFFSVPQDRSLSSAIDAALLQMQTEALQETGVLISQIFQQTNSASYEFSEEFIETYSGSVVQTQIMTQEYDGQDLYLKVEIVIDDQNLVEHIASLKSNQASKNQLEELKQQLAFQIMEKEQSQQELKIRTQQTKLQQAQISKLKQQVSLLERLNKQELTHTKRLERAKAISEKLKLNIKQRVSKQFDRFIADLTFFQASWQQGMTIRDAKQYHRFVHKPFYSELDQKNLTFTDAHYSSRFNPSIYDTYIIQQAIINDAITYLVAITYKSQLRIQNIYVASETDRISPNQIAVTSKPMLRIDISQLKP